jgi:ER membrane protein complex subunit 1
MNVRQILTSPALLESTSLVFAYGLDMFGTRVSPSKTFDVLSESFNKVQLIFTVAGLAIAIVITRPMVMRKKLRERWYKA